MLIRMADQFSAKSEITIEKHCGERDVTLFGAFSEAEKIKWTVHCDRSSGVTAVTMRLHQDGQPDIDMDLRWIDEGTYELELDMSEVGVGLYYYTFLLHRGFDILYTCAYDNVHFNLDKRPGKFFMLTVYDKDFDTPRWFRGGTMYQIFPDRFYKSGKAKQDRVDAVYESDWSAPISQYSLYPGAHLENNLFYGGDLWGVAEKLPYLHEMGVTIIYLNPIFKAYSNHRNDTGDYNRVDECLGGDEALDNLIREAEKYGIKLVLDGVFNHTGDDSIYFNRKGKYDSLGAWQSKESPYRDWYCFKPDGKYDSWWGIEILPRLNHNNEECRRFFTSDDGICAKYVNKNIGGWRLDVADELCDIFLDELRVAVKKANPDAIIIGEVWENAADKVAYGNRRKYVQGGQLDSVMNYPFRTSVMNYVLSGNSADLANTLTTLYASYPKCVSDSLMNIVGTHDTDRILTELGDQSHKSLGLSNSELSVRKMSPENRARAIKLLKIASIIQYTVYGVPSVYYGDEAGVEGYHDPFCRATFPWGNEETELVEHYRRLGTMRKREKVLEDGLFKVIRYNRGFIMFERGEGDEKLIVAANVNKTNANCGIVGRNVLTGEYFNGTLAPESAVIIKSFDMNEDR